MNAMKYAWLRSFTLMLMLLVTAVSAVACGSGEPADNTQTPMGTPGASASAGATAETVTPTSGAAQGTNPTVSATQQPTETSKPFTGNEKPDVIEATNKYADVKIYDKFGKWPDKTGKEYYSSEVGTWFTVWWTKQGEATYEFHWFEECRLEPTDYGYYSANDRDYLTSVFARLKYMDIDFILLDDTNGHWNDLGLIQRNIYACFKTAKLLNGFSPKIAIATGQPLRDGDTTEQKREYDAYYKLYQQYPGIFYEYNGKPLLVNYLANFANARLDDSRFTLRYGTGLISWQKFAQDQTIYKTQGNWGWVFDQQNVGSEVMGVQPGYNKPGMETAVVKRENGKHYIEQWLAAIKQNPKVIMIPSYNDHCEETGWEATTPTKAAGAGLDQGTANEDPYLYEKITEAYMALRYGYIEGFFYQVENTTQVYKCVKGELKKTSAASAGKNPIILLPKGYIEWEKNR